jgi:hypothetical protein
MRIVGNRTPSLDSPPLTPEEAWQRGRVLDAMLPNPLLITYGAVRLSHAQRNAQDDARMLAIARRLKSMQAEHGAT